MKVRYTARAFSDLDIIRTYINQFNPAATGRVIALIEKIVERLSNFPESGQGTDELDARIAFSPRYPYRIYYRVSADEVVILHIRHAARRPLQPNEI